MIACLSARSKKRAQIFVNTRAEAWKCAFFTIVFFLFKYGLWAFWITLKISYAFLDLSARDFQLQTRAHSGMHARLYFSARHIQWHSYFFPYKIFQNWKTLLAALNESTVARIIRSHRNITNDDHSLTPPIFQHHIQFQYFLQSVMDIQRCQRAREYAKSTEIYFQCWIRYSPIILHQKP